VFFKKLLRLWDFDGTNGVEDGRREMGMAAGMPDAGRLFVKDWGAWGLLVKDWGHGAG
jgi:hypothetical protein